MAVVSVSYKNETYPIPCLSPSGQSCSEHAEPHLREPLKSRCLGLVHIPENLLLWVRQGRVASASGRLWVHGMEGDPVDPLAELSFVSHQGGCHQRSGRGGLGREETQCPSVLGLWDSRDTEPCPSCPRLCWGEIGGGIELLGPGGTRSEPAGKLWKQLDLGWGAL